LPCAVIDGTRQTFETRQNTENILGKPGRPNLCRVLARRAHGKNIYRVLSQKNTRQTAWANHVAL